MTEAAFQSLPPFVRAIATRYGRVVRVQGDTPLGVGWSTEEVQHKRFDVLLSLLDHAAPDAPVTVSDLGCGWGALWDRIKDHKTPPVARYIGYDISTEMITLARQRTGHDTRARFVLTQGNTESVDYGFVSGTFNFHDNTPPQVWEDYVRNSLDHFAKTCKKGLAFNLLHHRARTKRPMFYADPALWLDRAHTWIKDRGGQGSVRLEEDYLPDDFTVLVHFDTKTDPEDIQV